VFWDAAKIGRRDDPDAARREYAPRARRCSTTRRRVIGRNPLRSALDAAASGGRSSLL
jgi:hypothetical protein